MSVRPVIPRERANGDVDEAVRHYLSEAGEQVALRFVDELERAYRWIGENRAGGSTRYAHELELPGLRTWPLRRYPHLIFYMVRADHVDVWRVLHDRRDIPAWMQEGTDLSGDPVAE